MIGIALTILVVGYGSAASWAVVAGPRRLWLVAVGALALLSLGSVLLGVVYAVPDMARLLLYVLALTSPVVLVPTLLLARTTSPRSEMTANLGTALLGAVVGLVVGAAVVVFVLRVW